nr:phosphate acyltransferase PlsX [Solirubrobacterales bacterium]
MAPERAVTVALDGFGAEQGFEVLAEGARLAAADGIAVRVFGPERSLGLDGAEGIEVIPASEWIGNDDDPVAAVRAKVQASVVQVARDVAEGRSQAMVSAGSTGATMAAATFGLRRLKGVQRPALAVQVPVPGKPVLFLDVGANVEVRAQHLVQFAFLGAAFSAAVLDVVDPTVGLLTVGEESGKGRPEIVAAHRLLSAAEGIEFAGNVEGTDLPVATVDVVVSDGFTGNVALKLLEGTARAVAAAVGDAARSNPLAALGGLLLKPALGGLRRELHPDTTGGAILL